MVCLLVRFIRCSEIFVIWRVGEWGGSTLLPHTHTYRWRCLDRRSMDAHCYLLHVARRAVNRRKLGRATHCALAPINWPGLARTRSVRRWGLLGLVVVELSPRCRRLRRWASAGWTQISRRPWRRAVAAASEPESGRVMMRQAAPYFTYCSLPRAKIESSPL